MSYMQPCSPVCPCPVCREDRARAYVRKMENAALWYEVKAVLAVAVVCMLLVWGCNP